MVYPAIWVKKGAFACGVIALLAGGDAWNYMHSREFHTSANHMMAWLLGCTKTG